MAKKTTEKLEQRSTREQLYKLLMFAFVINLLASAYVLYFQASVGLQALGAFNGIAAVLITYNTFIVK